MAPEQQFELVHSKLLPSRSSTTIIKKFKIDKIVDDI
jgi:hypothetical protein